MSITRKLDEKLCWVSDKGGQRDCTTTDLMALGYVPAPRGDAPAPANAEGGPPKELWLNWYPENPGNEAFGWAKTTKQECLRCTSGAAAYCGEPYLHLTYVGEMIREERAMLRDEMNATHAKEASEREAQYTKESTEYRKAFASAAEDLRAIQADIAQARGAIRAEQAAHEQEIVELQQEHQAKIDALRAQHEAEMTASTLAHAKAMTECNLRLAIRAKGANIGEKDGKTIMAEHPAQRMAREALAPLYAWINWRAPIFEEFAGDAFSERQLCVENWSRQKLHKAVPYVALNVVEAADGIVSKRIWEARDMVRRLVESFPATLPGDLLDEARSLQRKWAEEEPALRAAEGVKS